MVYTQDIDTQTHFARPNWPWQFTREGKTYYWTSKEGTSIATGLASAEYERIDVEDGSRVWLDSKGSVTPE